MRNLSVLGLVSGLPRASLIARCFGRLEFIFALIALLFMLLHGAP